MNDTYTMKNVDGENQIGMIRPTSPIPTVPKLTDAIRSAVSDELFRATETYGSLFNSDHEAYGVILEEFDEADRERRMFALDFEAFWMHCKTDHTDENPLGKTDVLATLSTRAIRAACEWVQIAAMCQKATNTIVQRRIEEEV